MAAIRSGFTVYYRSIFDTVRDFLHDEGMEGHERGLQRYLKPDLLIIDDMGMKQLPKRSGEYLFEIVMRRHELRSTMMTTNRPLEECQERAKDCEQLNQLVPVFVGPRQPTEFQTQNNTDMIQADLCQQSVKTASIFCGRATVALVLVDDFNAISRPAKFDCKIHESVLTGRRFPRRFLSASPCRVLHPQVTA